MTRSSKARAAFFALALAACDDAGKPLEPVWNKQACDHCHMLLSEPRYAAQLVTQSGERLYFDDVGCLAAYLNRSGARERAAWVHGPNGWLPAREAQFATGAETPMGYGFAPDATGNLDFAAVLQRVAARAAEGAPR